MKQQIARETKIFASNGIDYMEILIAHNGVEVWAAHSGHYKETKFDQIMADWKRQEEARKRNHKPTILELVFGYRKKVA